MAALLPTFIRDNPWWKAVAEIDRDPDLLRFNQAPIRFDHAIPFAFDADAVFSLRGPRQVGKSTLLKRAIQHLLRTRAVPPRCILYTDVEGAGLSTHLRLRNALSAYLTWARTSEEPNRRLYLFLDEVTGVKDWGIAVRTLHREGALTNVTVIATGSHALDLARGGETAPGRRGEHAVAELDWIMMPLAFRDYIAAHNPELAGVLPTIDLFAPHDAYVAAEQIQLHQDAISALFDRYLMTGGYPHAMSDEQSAGRIGAGAYGIYREAMIGQMRRAGHDSGPFREIVSWAADNRLGQEFSWSDISANTEIGSKDTARRYIEDAERLFLWHVLYRAQSADDSSNAIRSPKKLFAADPFAWHVLAAWAGGEKDAWSGSMTRLTNPTYRGGFVESVAGDHFLREFGRFALYHRADKGQGKTEEIDFILHRERQQARIEVKFRNHITGGHAKHLANHGGGILATPDDLAWRAADNVAVIPLPYLLAGARERLSLYPAHLP
jgi:uncharacterized protein